MTIERSGSRLSVIIPARNEANTLHDVLTAVKNMNPYEIIVIANGCTDHTAAIARRHGCRVIEDRQPLGNDVGRAVGAARASGDILLFIDADFSMPSPQLIRFLRPLYEGAADVVLNNFDNLFNQKKIPHSTTVWRQVFNVFVRRPDLNADSLLSVPHALTRRALNTISCAALANPIMAHLKIIQSGLVIAHADAIDVIRPNRYRREDHLVSPTVLSPSEQRMLGDHVAALSADMATARGGFGDGGRRRDVLTQLQSGLRRLPVIANGWTVRTSSRLYGGRKLSVIIPAQNEAATLRQVIREVRKIEPEEIIVVVNGSHDQTAKLAITEGAMTIQFAESLGNDVGRAIGAMAASGDIALFIDGDFVLPARDLYPYARAVSEGIDVAFNDLNHYLHLRHPLNPVTSCKYAVNLALNRKDLGVASLVAVPHAMSRKAMEAAGFAALASPVVAHVKAALAGCHMDSVYRTEVDQINRIRPEQHFSSIGYPPAVKRIIGDHLEGLSELVAAKGSRGLFQSDGRMWSRVNGLTLDRRDGLE